MHIRLLPADIPPAKSESNRSALPGPEARAARGHPNTVSHPGWDALVALARLLGRRAAQQHMLAQGADDAA